MTRRLCLNLSVLLVAVFTGSVSCFATDYITGPFERSVGVSIANVTEGGRIVWLSGEGGTKDENGKDITNDFEAQVRHTFYIFEQALKKAGGSIANITKMTVFLKDHDDGAEFIKIRKTIFPNENYPASSLITIKDLHQPGWKIEIEAFAVIGDSCSGGKCLNGK